MQAGELTATRKAVCVDHLVIVLSNQYKSCTIPALLVCDNSNIEGILCQLQENTLPPRGVDMYRFAQLQKRRMGNPYGNKRLQYG